jgi:hypothetical protein
LSNWLNGAATRQKKERFMVNLIHVLNPEHVEQELTMTPAEQNSSTTTSRSETHRVRLATANDPIPHLCPGHSARTLIKTIIPPHIISTSLINREIAITIPRNEMKIYPRINALYNTYAVG